MKTYKCIFFALVLSGCATSAQQESIAIKQGIAQLHANANVCRSTIDRNLDFAPIFRHMPLSTTQQLNPTLAQLTDEMMPSLQEAALVVRYRDATSVCREQFVAGLAELDPGMAEAFESAQATVSAVFVPLIEQRETWAVANRALVDAKERGSLMVHQAGANLDARLDAENVEELRNRAVIASAIGAAAGAAIQYNEDERLINAINRH